MPGPEVGVTMKLTVTSTVGSDGSGVSDVMVVVVAAGGGGLTVCGSVSELPANDELP